jgi:hypothetical protein
MSCLKSNGCFNFSLKLRSWSFSTGAWSVRRNSRSKQFPRKYRDGFDGAFLADNACPDKRLPHHQFRMDRSFGERPTRFLALLLAVRVDAAGGLVLLPATGRLVLLLFGFVPADKAACCCTQDTMMAGIVPCHAADESALEAAFG